VNPEHAPSSRRPAWADRLIAVLPASAGAGLCIALLGVLAQTVRQPLVIAPLAASAALAFAYPEGAPSQPRSIIGGHLISATLGLLCAALLETGLLRTGSLETAPLVGGLAVGLAILVMQLSRTFHAPAAATPLVVIAIQPSPIFLVTPVLLGTGFVVLSAWMYQRLFKRPLG
jgi:CBS-domain-containing membrane protein